MTEPTPDVDVDRFRDAMARSAHDVRVGPPPLGDLHDRARASRRRTRRRGAAAALAAVLVVGGGALGAGLVPDRAPRDVAGIEASDDGVPDGLRLVGVGRLGVLVPEDWGDAETGCGTPLTTGLVRDHGETQCDALVFRPAGAVSVTLSDDPTAHGWIPGSGGSPIGGLERSGTTCQVLPDAVDPPGSLCRASVTDGATGSVLVESSERDTEVARAQVDELAATVQLLPDGRAAVPELGYALDERTFDASAEVYAAALADLGLALETTERIVPGDRGGRLVEVVPAPGTILEPGATVAAVVAATPTQPVDFYAVSVDVWLPAGGGDQASDEEVRAGAAGVEVAAGRWATVNAESGLRPSDGTRRGGGPDGTDALVLSTSNPQVVAVSSDGLFARALGVSPGAAEITVAMTIDGELVPIGSVTVEVE